jgi:hypothetical protein
MTHQLPNVDRWVLLGDFNMVERRADKTNQCGKMLPQRERIVFEAMLNRLNVSELPRSQGSMTFSWDNCRWDGTRILARLDRMYMFPDPLPSGVSPLELYSIKGDGCRSDHCPVQACLRLEDTPRRPSCWKMNNSLLEEAKPALIRLWHAQAPGAAFFTKIRVLVRYFKKFCRDKAQEYRAEETQLRHDLIAATVLLQASPLDPVIQDQHGTLKNALRCLEDRKVNGAKVRSRVSWKLRGDAATKEFFAAVRERPHSTTIAAFNDTHGNTITDRTGIQSLLPRILYTTVFSLAWGPDGCYH